MRQLPDDMPARTTANEGAQYRQALSCFGTGVTVVTTRWQDQDWGMTCNSFASVSLEPRLVLWSIRKAASSLEAFTHSGGFSVSVLSHAQEKLARQFAGSDMASRFANVDLQRQASGRVRLDHAVAWFDCRLHQQVDAGDHHILIGEVIDFGSQDAAALGFWRSQFQTLGSVDA